MINQNLRLPVLCLVAWLVGVILWNVAGVIFIANTGVGIGPVASLPLAGVMVAIIAFLFLTARTGGLLFVALCALCAIAAFAAVYQAFTLDPSSWPSPFWRWAGAGLNLFGLVSGLMAIIAGMRNRSAPQWK